MPNFLIGTLVAFLEPTLHAWSNVFDNYFSNKLFPSLPTMIFFGMVLNLVFLPIVILIDPPLLSSLSLSLFGWICAIALIDVLFLFPYMWSLRHIDTSVVTSLFSLGRVFVPILAFFAIGEQLAPMQYVGFALIVFAATALTLDLKQLRFNTAFFLMLLVSILMAAQAVMYKYVFEADTGWGTVVTILTMLEIVISGVIMFARQSLSSIAEDFRTIRANFGLFALQQLFEWGGNVASSYAISVLPATVARSIASTQSFFVLGYAILFGKRFPEIFNESTARRELIQKGGFFALILIGVVLIIAYGRSLDI